jgi:hypothetical protein
LTELISQANAVTSATAYASALKFKVPPQTGKMMIFIKELGVNSITFKVLGSVNDVDYEDETAEEAVLDDAFDTVEVTKAWLYIDVQIKSTVENSNGKVNIAVSGST